MHLQFSILKPPLKCDHHLEVSKYLACQTHCILQIRHMMENDVIIYLFYLEYISGVSLARVHWVHLHPLIFDKGRNAPVIRGTISSEAWKSGEILEILVPKRRFSTRPVKTLTRPLHMVAIPFIHTYSKKLNFETRMYHLKIYGRFLSKFILPTPNWTPVSNASSIGQGWS